MTYRLTRRARQDVLDIWKYIGEQNEPAADEFADRLTRYFALLGDNPYAGRRRNDLRAGYRSFPVREYLVFYRIAEPGVQILRIVDGRRDIASLFRK